jgi:hypothetical protein
MTKKREIASLLAREATLTTFRATLFARALFGFIPLVDCGLNAEAASGAGNSGKKITSGVRQAGGCRAKVRYQYPMSRMHRLSIETR